MNVKTTLLGLIGSLVIAGAAHAETPLFSGSRANGGLGASAGWTAISFGELSAVGAARFSFTLQPEQTVGARRAVSTAAGNTPTIDHTGAYDLYRSTRVPSTYAIVYEDDSRANSRFGNDVNDMVVRVNVAAVPEPETYALMLAGLVAFFFVSRRRRGE